MIGVWPGKYVRYRFVLSNRSEGDVVVLGRLDDLGQSFRGDSEKLSPLPREWG